MVKQPSPRRTVRDTPAADESKTFRAAVSDVKPLVHTPAPAGLAKPAPKPRRLRRGAKTHTDLDELMPLLPVAAAGDPPSPAAQENPSVMGGPLSFQRAGVRTQVMRRLKRGLIPVEGEIDLHGLTQTSARDRLAEFLQLSRDAGFRCVRVIHGKGHRSGARGPVLKTAVDLWLRRHFDVMAFVSARAIDGGTGAVYVLLRV